MSRCLLLLVGALTALCEFSTAQSTESLTPLELQGRQIYQQGQDGSNAAINATLGLSNTTFSAPTFPCISCHGADGEGKSEGSLKIPAITATPLYSAIPSRKAYNDESLTQAITKGTNPDGQPLDAAMPRYSLSQPQMAALLAYLKRLGGATDLDPGLSADSIQLGSVLPLTGALQATGALLKATLNACVDEANAQGLIYGRRLTVIVEDSGSTAEGALNASQHLLASSNIFALLARFSLDDQNLPATNIPDIAPITFMTSTQSNADTARFYVLPSFVDQARALVDYTLTLPELTGLKSKPTLAIIYGQQTINKQVADAIRQQAALKKLASHTIRWQTGISNVAINTLMTHKPEAIFFVGDAQELKALNAALAKKATRPLLFGLLAMLGREILQSPPQSFAKLYLATPFAYTEDSLKDFATRLQARHVPMQNPGLQSITCAAVQLLVEGLKRSGRHVSRLKLKIALDTLHNFPVAFLPPVNFSPNAKLGLQGAYVMGVNPQGKLISQSDWISPTPVDAGGD